MTTIKMRFEMYRMLSGQRASALYKLTPQTTYRIAAVLYICSASHLLYPHLNPSHLLFQPFPTVIRFYDCEIILRCEPSINSISPFTLVKFIQAFICPYTAAICVYANFQHQVDICIKYH